MVELVVTMIVIGILAVVVMPRFANQLTFETRGFTDQTLATLQYARKVAVAAGRNVCVSASSGGITLTMKMASARGGTVDCSSGTAFSNPTGKWQTYTGITYSSALNTIFSGDGSATAGPPVPAVPVVSSLTVFGDGTTYTIVVETTGYVHCSPVTSCD